MTAWSGRAGPRFRTASIPARAPLRSLSTPGSGPAVRASGTRAGRRSRPRPGSPACWTGASSSGSAAGTKAGRSIRTPSSAPASPPPAGGWSSFRRWRRSTSRARASVRSMRQYRRYGYYRAKTSRAHPDSMRATPPRASGDRAAARGRGSSGRAPLQAPGAHRGRRLRNRDRRCDRRPPPARTGLRLRSGCRRSSPPCISRGGRGSSPAASGGGRRSPRCGGSRGSAEAPSPLGERRSVARTFSG